MALTTTGICIQILSSLSTFRRERVRCTENDCKVVLNHLIRKFSEPLLKQKKHQIFRSKNVNGFLGETIDDHVVPVKVLMQFLLDLDDSEIEINEENIVSLEELLSSSLILVEITPDEDLKLNAAGFQSKMPAGWSIKNDSQYKDPWARYKAAGIYDFVDFS